MCPGRSPEPLITMKQHDNTLSRAPSARGAVNRRAFLTGVCAAGMAACASALPSSADAAQTDSAPAAGTAQPMATLFDLSRCEGCGACVDACTERNARKYPQPRHPFPAMFPARVRAEDWSDKQEVTDRLTPYNWLTIQHVSVTYKEKTYELHIPRRCMHCDNPLCANLCPWGAAYKENSGTVRIDDDICLGGAKCRQVCPWDIPQRQTGVGLYLDLLPRFAGNGVMYKCDRCHDSVKQGALPACVEACPLGVQEYGPRDAIISKARKLAQATDGYLYGLDEAGGTSTIYVSPVPFELLNTSLTRSAGHPDFPPVQPVLQPQKHLAGALMVAPLAGMAAGALKILGTLRKDRDSGHAPAAAHNKEQDHE